ncbi:MAG: helix-turn-helix transcriptional regulator [Pararhodobacter sp.]
MNAHSPFTSPYLTVEQVAKHFNVSTATIWRLKRDGEFPAPVRIGKNCTRWRLADVLEHESKLKACLATDLSWLRAS